MVIKGGSSEVYSSFLSDVIESVPSLSGEDVSLSQEDVIQLINSISQLDFVDNIYFNGAEDNLIFSDNKFIAPVSNETTEERLKKLGNSDDEIEVIATSVDTTIQDLREKSKSTISEESTNVGLGVTNESETNVLLNLFKSVTPNGYFKEQQKMMLLEDENLKQDYQLDTDEDEIIGGKSEENYINDDEDESDFEESYINDDEDESDFESTGIDSYSDDDEDEEYEPDVTLSYRNIEVQTQADYIDDDDGDNIEDVSLNIPTEMSDYVDDEDDEESNELIPDSSDNIQEMGYNNISSMNGKEGVVQDNLDNESSLYPAYFNSEDGVDNFVSASSTNEEYEDDEEYTDDDGDEDSDEDSDSNDTYFDDSDDEDSDEDSDSDVIASSDSYFDDDDEEDESESSDTTSYIDDEDDELGGNSDTSYVDDDEDEIKDTNGGNNQSLNTVSYSTDNYSDDDDDEDGDEVPKYNTTFDDSYSADDDSEEEEDFFNTQGNLGTNSFNNSGDIVDNFNHSSSSANQEIISNVREETSDDKLANSIARLAEGVIKLPRTIKKGIRSARDYMRVDDDEVSENNIIQKRGN